MHTKKKTKYHNKRQSTYYILHDVQDQKYKYYLLQHLRITEYHKTKVNNIF